MKGQNKFSKSEKNYYVDIVSLLLFLILLFSGIIMLGYHAGKSATQSTLNFSYDFWMQTHIIFAVISFVAICIHLSLHINWFKKLFSGKTNNKHWVSNLILIFLFLITTLTSILPWLNIVNSDYKSLLLGIHNKFGLLLLIFFVVHLFSYFNWLVNTTRKIFQPKY